MMSNKINSIQKGYIAAILAAIFFGSSGLFVKLAYGTGIGAIDLLIVQNLIAVTILWSVCFIRYRKEIIISKNLLIKFFFLGAFLNSFTTLFYYKSFEYLDMSVATMLLFTYPIIITLYSLLFGKEKPSSLILASLIIVFLGCILVLNLFSMNITVSIQGILYGIGAAIVYAWFNLYVETFIHTTQPFVLATYSSTFSLLFFSVYRFSQNPDPGNITLYQLMIAGLLVLFCQIPPVTLLYHAIHRIGAIKTSIISNIEIPGAAILGYTFYHEMLSGSQFIGILLVLGGILLMKNGELLKQYLPQILSSLKRERR
jgi:drug/metabolite transporter (DMT)-like permease